MVNNQSGRPTLPKHAPGPAGVPDAERIRALAVRLAALSHNGLVYSSGDYDTDRYEQMSQIADTLLATISGRDATAIHTALGLDTGYVTPKVDVRGVLFDEHERVLLMRERIDGLWSLPGGWADPGDSPAQAVEREMLEESGHVVRAVKLIGCWDRDVQGHVPPMSVGVYKLFFLCEQRGESRPPDELETLDTGWFGLDSLPALSLGRVMEHQLRIALDHHRDPSLPTAFD